MKVSSIESLLFIVFNLAICLHSRRLENIPRLEEPSHYTGYLNGGQDIHLHYWFVESQGNPKTDPIVLWLNGGPGESSLWGMFLENGPLKFKSDGKTLSLNRLNSWNTLANVLYLETPVGVGFSYSTSNETFKHNDNTTATMNRLAIEDFFVKYPQLRSNKFYIAGEDYAGVYEPMLALEILESLPEINLKGIAIIDGYFGNRFQEHYPLSTTYQEMKNIMRHENDLYSVIEHMYMKKYIDEVCSYNNDTFNNTPKPYPNCPLGSVKTYLNSAENPKGIGHTCPGGQMASI